MGNQINYYIDKETEISFFNDIFADYSVFKEDDNQINKIDEVPKGIWWKVYLHKKEFGEIMIKEYDNGRKVIDSDSVVIEYSTTAIDHEDKELRRGRIYINMNFLEGNEWRKKPEILLKSYQSLNRKIKKRLEKYEEKNIKGIVYNYLITDGIKRYINEGYKLR